MGIEINKHGTQAGKGDKPRAVKGEDYRSNFDRIFRAVKQEDIKLPQTPWTKALYKSLEDWENRHQENNDNTGS